MKLVFSANLQLSISTPAFLGFKMMKNPTDLILIRKRSAGAGAGAGKRK